MEIKINIPVEIEEYGPELQYFMQTMVAKLHTNRHKGMAEGYGLKHLFDAIGHEADELMKALDKEGQFEVFVEACDVANQAWLLASKTLRMTRKDFDNERN